MCIRDSAAAGGCCEPASTTEAKSPLDARVRVESSSSISASYKSELLGGGFGFNPIMMVAVSSNRVGLSRLNCYQ